jgi:hypothetical protein
MHDAGSFVLGSPNFDGAERFSAELESLGSARQKRGGTGSDEVV